MESSLPFGQFFFKRISASGFGLMRVLWSGGVFITFICQVQDVARYYSNAGLVPMALKNLEMRADSWFSIFQWITSPEAVLAVYIVFLFLLILSAFGWKPRLTTSLSVLLLFSFHERNLLPLGGGDTVFRLTGFLLLLSPELRAFSVERVKDQWQSWKKNRVFLEPLTMSAWPYHLLLWQLIVLYITSGWDKTAGTMWWDGTAVASVFHHTDFSRWPRWIMDYASIFSAPFSVFTLVWEWMWLFVLVPTRAWKLAHIPLSSGTIKRAVLLGGVLLHGGIGLFMDVGSFPLALAAIYAGALKDDDFHALRHFCNKWFKGTIAVLYDGRCGLCLRSAFWLGLLDSLHRLTLVNFREADVKNRWAPDITEETLDASMHIVLANGTSRRGFYAFRTMAWHLPVAWLAAPLLYVPGVPAIGERVYARIAANRKKCSHEGCAL